MSLLCVKDLHVQFHEREQEEEAVRRLSFTVRPGEVLGVVGESGSGKSTAMQAILGLLPERAQVSCRQIMLDGADITPPPPGADRKSRRMYEHKMEGVRGCRIGMVFQEPLSSLNPSVKVGRQITETICAHRKCSKKAAKERAAELLGMVGIAEGEMRMRQYPFELSGGMRQRVALAIALAGEPRLLIADEPTTALDVTVQAQILDLLKRIAEETGMAMILVSHDLRVIAALCRRVLVLKDGVLVEEGTAEQMFQNPKHAYTRELVRHGARLDKPSKLVGNAEYGKESGCLLTVDAVSRAFSRAGSGRRIEAVRRVFFQIGRGETLGLVGESGCGKSTLASLVTGMLSPDGGTVQYHGEGRVQMVFQDPYASLNPRMTVGDALAEPLMLNTDMSKEERSQRVREMLLMTGLRPEDAAKYPQAFSGGQRQRICIARALIAEPRLVVCDEPVTSLDVTVQAQILELLERVQRERQISYLFISHDLQVVRRLSRRVGIMYAGSIVESGDTETVYKEPWHPYTQTLLAAALTHGPQKGGQCSGSMHWLKGQAAEIPERGCPFAPRCAYAMERCGREMPEMQRIGAREVACFLLHRKAASQPHIGAQSTQDPHE